MKNTKILRIAMVTPDIPQNAGAMLRLCAAMDIGFDIIGPTGFIMDDRKLKRAAMDYIQLADRQVFSSWNHFFDVRKENRLVLMTTKTDKDYLEFEFKKGDILLAGSESSGVSENIHESCDERITIKMNPAARSLNVVNATSMITGEALRQIRI